MSKIDLSQYNNQSRTNISSTNWLTKDIELPFQTNKFSDNQKQKIYGQLGMLLKSDVDLKTCLDILIGQQEKKKHTQLLSKITEEVVKGANLCDAFQKFAKITPYEYFSIQIGEETGKLAYVLNELKDFYKQKIEQRRKFISAFSYPIVVLSTAVVVVFFMLRFLVPMFENVYKRFGGELPYLTKQLVIFSNFLSQFGLYFMLTILSIAVIYYSIKNRESVRKLKSSALFNMPILGKLLQKYYLGRFTRFMYLLTSSNVPLTKALDLTKKVIGVYPLETALNKIEQDIVNGQLLSTAMMKHAFFDKKSVALIKVGEEVNQLDKMFKELSDEYKNEFEHQTDLLNKFFGARVNSIFRCDSWSNLGGFVSPYV